MRAADASLPTKLDLSQLHELVQRLFNVQLSTAANNVDEPAGNSEEEPPP